MVVADVSSHILSRPVDWSRLQVVYGGAQKNIGPAGVTIVIVREDLLGHAHPLCPSAFNWRLAAEHGSMYNTPPTYAIYIAGTVFQWLKRQGGVPAVEQRNIAKAKALYDFLDQSAFYRNEIDPSCRSRMNVPFFPPTNPATKPSGQRAPPGWCSSRATSPWAACGRVSTTRCRSRA